MVCAAVVVVAAMQLNVTELLQPALDWVDRLGTWGPIAFIVLYSVATILLIPGSLITLSGGAIFGLVPGVVYVFAGAVVGATLAFLIGRYVARGWVARQIEGNARFKAIDNAIAREGFKIVLLTRLSPVFPFALLNYGLGITQVSLRDYLSGFVGMIPAIVTYVYIGSLTGSLAAMGTAAPANPQAQQIQWLIRLLGLLATIAITVYVTRVAKKALNESIASGNAQISSGDR